MGLGNSGKINPERLQELERFAEIGRLSASMLHEINNPLTAAMLWLEQCNVQQPHIQHARSSIHLLHRYVEAARQQLRREGRRRDFCVQSELEQAWHVLAPLARRREVSLRFASAEDCILHGDPVRFQQIIANLVRNAIDAYDNCPPGSRRKSVRLDVHARQDHLVIEVSDRGCGIASNQLERLFEPFYTTKGGTGLGLGIGLSAAKRSIETDFRGSIKVRSSKRRGTKFIVKLSTAPAASENL